MTSFPIYIYSIDAANVLYIHFNIYCASRIITLLVQKKFVTKFIYLFIFKRYNLYTSYIRFYLAPQF